MPIDDIDIWRSAKLLIDRHGDDAKIYAAGRRTKRSPPLLLSGLSQRYQRGSLEIGARSVLDQIARLDA